MEKLASKLAGIKTVAIAGHVRPDGDCIVSCMGLYLYLKENEPDIKCDVYLETAKEGFSYIKNLEEAKQEYDSQAEYDLLILLDVSSPDRIGVAGEALKTAKKTICLDHHISNHGFADENLIEPEMSSASELLFHLLEEEKITKDVAEAIYTGIASDTGVFKYSCTSPETMRVVAKLMEKGIDFSSIIDQSFYEKSYVQNQILGRCLMESIQVLDKKCIIGCLRKRDLDFYGVGPKELDGIVEQLRLTRGVEVAVFIYETKTQEFKVSLRSKSKVDVNKVASYFSGGGHVRAAGCTMQGSIYDVMNNLLKQIEKEIKEKMQ